MYQYTAERKCNQESTDYTTIENITILMVSLILAPQEQTELQAGINGLRWTAGRDFNYNNAPTWLGK